MSSKTSPVLNKVVKTLLYAVSSGAGTYHEINFLNKSIQYFDVPVSQAFQNILIDNIGDGDVRFTFNSAIDITLPTTGAKTLVSKDSIFFQDNISYIRIYFITASTIEVVGIYDGDDYI